MLALIGGTGLNTLKGLEGFSHERSLPITTRYAESPVTIDVFEYSGRELLFLPRHGAGHVVPPHQVNYRANIDALRLAGATQVIAMNAVGGIDESFVPGALSIPDQLIDYSSGREHTFFETEAGEVVHIDFGLPYAESLRQLLVHAGARANEASGTQIRVIEGGVYGCTQGPRLETNAEIRRLRADGCTMVGMTGMPEAALAREAQLDYACIALCVNWAAGLTAQVITLPEIYAVIDKATPFLAQLLRELIAGPQGEGRQ